MRIRPFKPQDAASMTSWFSDEFTLRRWCAGRFSYPLTQRQLEEYYQQEQQRPDSIAMTALGDDDKPEGHFLLTRIDWAAHTAYLAFVVVEPRLRGKGAGKQMVGLAMDYARRFLGVQKVTLRVFANNPGAVRCYEGLGFRQVSSDPAAYTFDGEAWAGGVMEATL